MCRTFKFDAMDLPYLSKRNYGVSGQMVENETLKWTHLKVWPLLASLISLHIVFPIAFKIIIASLPFH